MKVISIPQGYDPITLNHYLWYRLKCHECPPTEFQSLFENIVKRADPQFMQIRPYGNLGDRKCDGLFEAKGHIFQVYSPDELRQADLITKIDDDLGGAVKHWGGRMTHWTFVYNTRAGLSPDVPAILQKRRKLYRRLKLDSWSEHYLWEMARKLSHQQRSEILGAPNGYEHLFLAASSSPDDIKQALENGYFVIVHDTMTPINYKDAIEAMRPMVPFGAPFYIRPSVGQPPWDEVAEFQKLTLREVIEKSRGLIPRFAVFSLSQIALCIHLGFVLSDRLEVRYFQFDRDRKTWRWPEDASDADRNISVNGLPEALIDKPVEVIIRISLSAIISPNATHEAAGNAPIQIDLTIKEPDVMWLKSPDQLSILGQKFRGVLSAISNKVPYCKRIHLFYAGPTGGAVVIGQQVNPRTNPPVVLYEYSCQGIQQHRYALTLKDEAGITCGPETTGTISVQSKKTRKRGK
jgi:hypothetical protein